MCVRTPSVFGSICTLTHLQILSMFLMKTNPWRPVLIVKFIEMCAIWSKIDLKGEKKHPKIFAFGYWASFHLIKNCSL